MNPLANPAAPTAAQMAAKGLTGRPAAIFRQWKDDMTAVWNNPRATPQQVFDAMGMDATHMVDGNNAMLAMFRSPCKDGSQTIDEDELRPYLALIKPFTVNNDGTVTVNS